MDPQERAGDADLLLAEAERINLLAESCFNQGDFANARKWYARRLEMGGSGEPFYFASYRLAASMQALGEPWTDVEDAYLKAWEFRPTRAEPLYVIACHYRVKQDYRLGYQFAQRAAELPLPEGDKLFVETHVYAWAALDEQAVCAHWLGRHDEAFTLSRRLLARPDLPDAQRPRIALNRDFSAPAMLEATSSYPDALVGNLIAGPRDAEVTVSLIAGPDHSATEQTLNSFLNCCTDVARVGRFLVVYAGMSALDRAGLRERAMLRERYPFVEFADCGSAEGTGADGPGALLAPIRAQIGGQFWLHLGQGWRFFAPDNFITRLTAVLEAEHDVFQVGINFTDAVEPIGTCAAGPTVRRSPDAGRYVLTDAAASGPALFDTARLDRAVTAGLHTATLDEVLCRSSSPRTATTRVEVISPPAASTKKVHRFCVTHKEPLIPASWYDDCIALGSYQSDSVSHVSQLDRFWHEARPIAYGAAGSYVLPIAIERLADAADLIEISSYRKKILLSPEGVESEAYQKAWELTVEECREKTELSSVITPPNDSGFLVSQPLYFEQAVVGVYAGLFRFRDILDYTSLAIEMGVLNDHSAAAFLTMKQVIPGGTEFGIFPKSWLVPALSQIERLSREFLGRYGNRIKEYNAFQIRAVGFLSEQLGSFLLIRHLSERYSNDIPADIFGYMTCVVENGKPYHVGIAD